MADWWAGRSAPQDPRTWDYFEDNRASNDTWVSVDLNAGFTSVMAGMNQARPHVINRQP